MSKKAKSIPGAPWHEVHQSNLHGTGVFALRDIPEGTRIFEYIGKRISAEQADAMFPVNPDDPYHTFFFALSSGQIIDGGQGGNDARWINHSCEPNCETIEGRHGKRVYIQALRDIAAGEELLYDYGLVIDEVMSEELKQQYRCLCGSAQCRGTMLALVDEVAETVDEELANEAPELQTEVASKKKKTAKKTKKAKASKKADKTQSPKKAQKSTATKKAKSAKSSKKGE